MRRNVLIASAVAILGLVLLIWQWPSTSKPQDASARSADDEQILARRRAARQSGDYDNRPARITGSVVEREGGAGIPGAIVSIAERSFDGGARGRPGATPEPITAITDPQGAFEVPSLPPGRYSVSATARSYMPGLIDPVDLAPGEQRSGLDLSLAKGGNTLSGTVTDIGGGPVAGALVRAQPAFEGSIMAMFRAPYSTSTDPAGRYELQLGDGQYETKVIHPDYVESSEEVEISGGPRELNFTLTPGAVIEGRVIARATDEPVSGAMVSQTSNEFAVTGFGPGAAVSDDEGRFMLRGLGPGAVQLGAIGRGFATAEPLTVEIGIGEHVTDVVIYVDKAYTVSGFVVDKDDHDVALPSILVAAFNMNPGALHIASDPSAEDGYFEILGVKPGTYTMGAVGEARVPIVFGTTILVDDKDISDVLVELDAGVTVSGRVEPAARARISLEIDEASMGFNFAPMIAAVMAHAKADDQGEFSLRGLAKGSFTLVAKTDDGREGRVPLEIEMDDVRGLVVKLEDRASVSGIVVDANGSPLAGAKVEIEPKKKTSGFGFGGAPWGKSGALSQQDGRFEHVGLRAGEHTVSVRINDQRLAWAKPEKPDAAHEPIEIEIEGTTPIRDLRLEVESRNKQLTGTVVGPGGARVADAWVTARFIPPPGAGAFDFDEVVKKQDSKDSDSDGDGESGDAEGSREVSVTVQIGGGGGNVESETTDKDDVEEHRERVRRWNPAEQPVLTDEDGRFVITGLRDGKYDLEAEGLKGSARGFARDVVSGTDVVVRLDPLSTIKGVVSKSGNPVTEYSLELSGPTNRRKRISSKDGRYELARLDPGKYKIHITSTSGRASAELTVEPNRTATQNLDLVPYSTITGQVVDAQTNEPMKDYAVMAFTEGSDTSQMMDLFMGGGPKTDGEGRFKIERLGAGEGTVLVLDGDRNAMAPIASQSFELAPGEDKDLGTIHGSSAGTVPRDQRGDFGMILSSGTWKQRPGSKPGDKHDPPSGMDAETEYLWVSEVTDGGPAAEAGLQIGDRIVSVDGMDLERVGAQLGQQFLAPIRTKVGDTKTLSFDRDGKRETATLTATPAEPSD